MNPIDYWRLAEAVTVFQAAYLITGTDPADLHSGSHSNGWHSPEGYGAAITALRVGIRNGSINAEIVEEKEYDDSGHVCGYVQGSIDIDRTFVNVVSLIDYLRRRNFKSSAFGVEIEEQVDYLDPQNPFYAPKLAAAVSAWVQVTRAGDGANTRTPKMRLDKWLREHAARFGLTKADGTVNEEAIQQISKIANWKPEGGAAKTPVKLDANGVLPSQSAAALKSPERKRRVIDPDDEIPF